MIDTTHQSIQAIADFAEWNDRTLLHLIACWVDELGEADDLLVFLNRTASEEDDVGTLD